VLFGRTTGDTAPVDSYGSGASPFGLLNMAGNVWEWVQDPYATYPGGAVTNPKWFWGSGHVIRGGGCNGVPADPRAAYRQQSGPEGRDENLGFRCARDDVP
jgi:formylglycine-generating enzyme required for sulfatase activity